MGMKKKIATISFQSSVVVKGIERKLKELGYEVISQVGDFEKIREIGLDAEVFITYLPGMISDDQLKVKRLSEICDSVASCGCKMMIIGEGTDYHDLYAELPKIGNYRWVSRPLDMNNLGVLIDELEGHTASPVKPVVKKKRILIVDDDPSYAKMVREWIKDDYRVDIVTAGMQAITFLLKVPADDKVDIILLDYEMPVVDGPQVLQMLRQEPATADIPVMFLTGLGTREAVSRVMELKPEGYILKSVTREDLLKTLHTKLHG